MLESYEGPLQPGMVFRHRAVDVRCEVIECVGAHVSTRSVDLDGQRSKTVVPYTVQSFRSRWLPERRRPERWSAEKLQAL